MNTISKNRTVQGVETEAIIVTTESQLATIFENVLDRFLNRPAPEPSMPKHTSYWSGADTFDMNEAAQYMKLSKSHLWKLTAVGKIPCSKVFGRLKFDKKELDAWLEGQGSRRGDSSSVTLSLAKSANRKLRGSAKIVKICDTMS